VTLAVGTVTNSQTGSIGAVQIVTGSISNSGSIIAASIGSGSVYNASTGTIGSLYVGSGRVSNGGAMGTLSTGNASVNSVNTGMIGPVPITMAYSKNSGTVVGYAGATAGYSGNFGKLSLSINDYKGLKFYDRNKAAAYAIEWGKKRNSAYEDFNSPTWTIPSFIKGLVRFTIRTSSDCGNFVSQALFAGGVEMNENWYFKYVYRYSMGGDIASDPSEPLASNPTYKVSEWTASWAAVSNQYQYFSDPKNGYSNSKVYISDVEDIKEAVKSGSVRVGDLVYWFEVGKELPHHAAIVSAVGSSEIYYAAHSNDHIRNELSKALGSEYVRILNMNDLIPKGANFVNMNDLIAKGANR